MSSITRRFERYQILYCYKITHRLVLNCGLKWETNEYTGTQFIQTNCKKYENSTRTQSFHYMGPRLYNSLPQYLRNIDLNRSLLDWKIKLDNFLSGIPDNPVTSPNESGQCDMFTAKQTNSLLSWIPFLGLSGRREKEASKNNHADFIQ